MGVEELLDGASLFMIVGLLFRYPLMLPLVVLGPDGGECVYLLTWHALGWVGWHEIVAERLRASLMRIEYSTDL